MKEHFLKPLSKFDKFRMIYYGGVNLIDATTTVIATRLGGHEYNDLFASGDALKIFGIKLAAIAIINSAYFLAAKQTNLMKNDERKIPAILIKSLPQMIIDTQNILYTWYQLGNIIAISQLLNGTYQP